MWHRSLYILCLSTQISITLTQTHSTQPKLNSWNIIETQLNESLELIWVYLSRYFHVMHDETKNNRMFGKSTHSFQIFRKHHFQFSNDRKKKTKTVNERVTQIKCHKKSIERENNTNSFKNNTLQENWMFSRRSKPPRSIELILFCSVFFFQIRMYFSFI